LSLFCAFFHYMESPSLELLLIDVDQTQIDVLMSFFSITTGCDSSQTLNPPVLLTPPRAAPFFSQHFFLASWQRLGNFPVEQLFADLRLSLFSSGYSCFLPALCLFFRKYCYANRFPLRGQFSLEPWLTFFFPFGLFFLLLFFTGMHL